MFFSCYYKLVWILSQSLYYLNLIWLLRAFSRGSVFFSNMKDRHKKLIVCGGLSVHVCRCTSICVTVCLQDNLGYHFSGAIHFVFVLKQYVSLTQSSSIRLGWLAGTREMLISSFLASGLSQLPATMCVWLCYVGSGDWTQVLVFLIPQEVYILFPL